MRRSKCCRAFTLVEVMVALGIVSGALILLLSAGQGSLKRSIRSAERTRMDEIAESKLDEIRCGVETATSGRFNGFSDLSWELRREKAEVDDLKGIENLTLVVRRDTAQLMALSVFHFDRKAIKE